MKALLYMSLADVRRSLHPERTEAMKKLAGLKSSGKRAKAERKIDRVIDYVLIDAPPEHLESMADATGESGRHMKTHWRRGHFKDVWTGVGRTKLEVRWIKTTLVAPTPGERAPAVKGYVVR